MSQIRNYIVGTFETITLAPIGQADGSVQFLFNDKVLTNAISDLVLYTDSAGASAVPLTDYSMMTTDTIMTTAEAGIGGSGKTVYSQFQVTNATYQGIDLWATFTNFGTYTDNDALGDLLPDTDWRSYENYTTIPTTARFGGGRYVNYVASNSGNIPPLNPDKWLPIQPRYELIQASAEAKVISAGVIDAHDRSNGNYQQNILVDTTEIDGTTYNLYYVHLDGTQVTGDATLESIFDPGGSDEYHSIDIYAPDVLGTRTLLDMGDYVSTPQSSSGDADTVGALVDDQFQGHWHDLYATTGVAVAGGSAGRSVEVPQTFMTSNAVRTPGTDGVNGIPRTGSTTHGKRFTVGASYIVVMVAA